VRTLGASSPGAIALLAVIALVTLSALYATLRLSPWYPTRTRDFERIRTLLDLKPGQTVYDLGCGDGRVIAYLSRTTGARCIGVELSILHYSVAKLRQLLGRRANLEVRLGDLFRQDLRDADVVYMFGIPSTMRRDRLAPVLAAMRPGARLVSYGLPVDGLTPHVVDRATGGREIYVYVVSDHSPAVER
jgi:SAM-dependent methyltransferase